MDAILDTSIIIDLFKGDRDLLEKLPKNFIYGISVVTLFELHCGNLKEREELFLEKMPKISLEESSARLAGKIFRSLRKEGKIPKVKDLLIASSAIANDLVVVTRDRDFEIFKSFGLKVEVL